MNDDNCSSALSNLSKSHKINGRNNAVSFQHYEMLPAHSPETNTVIIIEINVPLKSCFFFCQLINWRFSNVLFRFPFLFLSFFFLRTAPFSRSTQLHIWSWCLRPATPGSRRRLSAPCVSLDREITVETGQGPPAHESAVDACAPCLLCCGMSRRCEALTALTSDLQRHC